MKKIGFLTSGGDCQSLNATMRGVAKTLYQTYPDVEIYGILEGYKGLIYGKYRKMQPSDFSGILTEGGTIIGTSTEARCSTISWCTVRSAAPMTMRSRRLAAGSTGCRRSAPGLPESTGRRCGRFTQSIPSTG